MCSNRIDQKIKHPANGTNGCGGNCHGSQANWFGDGQQKQYQPCQQMVQEEMKKWMAKKGLIDMNILFLQLQS